MAIFFLAVKTVSRARGQSALASAAYRSGQRLRCARLGKVFDYRHRSRSSSEIVASELFGWQGSRSDLWNAAERAETNRDGSYRSKAVVAREVLVALPHELPQHARHELATEYTRYLCDRYNVAADMNIHRPRLDSLTEGKNYHSHILLTVRRVDEAGDFSEKTRELDEQKTRSYDPTGTLSWVEGRGPSELREIRKKWEDLCNAYLARHGISERISCLSLEAQGKTTEALSLPRGVLEQMRKNDGATVVANAEANGLAAKARRKAGRAFRTEAQTLPRTSETEPNTAKVSTPAERLRQQLRESRAKAPRLPQHESAPREENGPPERGPVLKQPQKQTRLR